jgi:hypothetical protein
MMRVILDDVVASNIWGDTGGITEIKETGNRVFVVRLPQEERVDLRTYELAVDDDCQAHIVRLTPGVVSYGPEPESPEAPTQADETPARAEPSE